MAPFDSPFSRHEFAGRLEQVQAVMKSRRIDWAILDEPETMGWLTGYVTTENLWRACIVPEQGLPFLLLRSLDAAPARHRSWCEDIITFVDWEEPVDLLARTLKRVGATRIGADFQSNSFTHRRYCDFKDKLPDVSFVDLERSIWDLRRIKSRAEIAHMRRGASLLDRALECVVAEIEPGRSQREIAALAASTYYRLGFDDGLVGYVTAGTGWDSLHGFMNDEPLEDGQVVHLELLPRFRNYTVRIMRSVVVGEASREQRAIFETLCSLQDRQIDAMKPGTIARDIDAIVRDGVLAAGLRESYDNITGYTLGFSATASQRVSDLHRCFTPAAAWELEADMVFHMYTSAGGLALSETVLVTADGGERLTRTPRRLFQTVERSHA